MPLGKCPRRHLRRRDHRRRQVFEPRTFRWQIRLQDHKRWFQNLTGEWFFTGQLQPFLCQLWLASV